MKKSPLSFAVNIPRTEEDMVATIYEILNVHSDQGLARLYDFAKIRDDLQKLVNIMTDFINDTIEKEKRKEERV